VEACARGTGWARWRGECHAAPLFKRPMVGGNGARVLACGLAQLGMPQDFIGELAHSENKNRAGQWGIFGEGWLVGQRTRARSLVSEPHGARGPDDNSIGRALLVSQVELVDWVGGSNPQRIRK
jgi:hypothetical protein